VTVTLDATAPTPVDQGVFGHAGTTVPDTVGRPTKFLVSLVMFGSAATGTLTLISPADAIALTSWAPAPTTVSALPQQPFPMTSDALTAGVLQRLRRTSGLNWGDVARALGVSRRTIHNWLGGARIAGVHLVRLLNFERLVNTVALGRPEDTRAYLLRPQATGRSIVDDMALSSRPVRRTPMSTLSAADQLAPVSDEPEVVQPLRRSALRGGQVPRKHSQES
jgi:transcriptional regulator with XRE-family HTH domain